MINYKYYYPKKIIRRHKRRQAFRKIGSHLDNLYRSCLENVIPVTEPVALISQIQRSGGSLLSQLFDGHPQIHAHPDELKVGYPKKYIWPPIHLEERPEKWFEMLFEESVIHHFKEGYRKGQKSDRVFPFIFLPPLQKMIFLKWISANHPAQQRTVFDAYMTSYFGAWVNYQNFVEPKKYVTGFTPRLAMEKESIASFFEVYPDGRLISSIRDPRNWYPSAHRHNDKKGKYEDIEKALEQWQQCAQSLVENKALYGERVCIIRFEDLIRDTVGVMRHLAEFLQIEFDEILLTPTFNKLPISANTSFLAEKPGIVTSTLSRYKTLTEMELEAINSLTKTDYANVLAVTHTF